MLEMPHRRYWPERPRSPWLAPLRALGRALVMLLVVAYGLLNALVLPLVRPLLDGLGRLPALRLLGGWIGRLPPYVVLVLLGVPFVVIEPLKAVALYWMALGHFASGLALLVGAELMSLFVVERLYHAGHTPLMRIVWFRRLMAWLTGLRDLAFAWARTTGLWRAGQGFARSFVAAARRIDRA
jgi:hypothetical protein